MSLYYFLWASSSESWRISLVKVVVSCWRLPWIFWVSNGLRNRYGVFCHSGWRVNHCHQASQTWECGFHIRDHPGAIQQWRSGVRKETRIWRRWTLQERMWGWPILLFGFWSHSQCWKNIITTGKWDKASKKVKWWERGREGLPWPALFIGLGFFQRFRYLVISSACLICLAILLPLRKTLLARTTCHTL